MEIIKKNGGRNLDLSAAAKNLGVTESILQYALSATPEK